MTPYIDPKRPIIALEEFGYPWHTSTEFKPAMEKMLAGRWEKAGYLVTDMRPPIDFDGHPRTHACDLHSWEPVGYALRAYEVFEDRRYLDLSCGYIFDWLDRYYMPVAHRRDRKGLDALIADERTFAWYDMAVGRRIFRLAYLLDVLAREPDSDERRLRQLWEALQFHHAMLGREHFFRSDSNHGIHQALGQLAAARRFSHKSESIAQYALARRRFMQVLDLHFSVEGVHREHSPGYHYGLLASFIGASAAGLLDDPQLKHRIEAMEDVLAWMIQPNGRIAPLGDTDPKRMMRSQSFVSQFSNPGLQYQLSGGLLGSEPESGAKVFLESGYVFVRLTSADTKPLVENTAYLAQIAAFHSGVHKHADHLGFIWFDRKQDILIDPGRYAYAGRTEIGSDLFKQGFWYSDPKRIYVESTRAHNCVEIDGRSYPRRNVEPFGSALRYAGEQDGLAVTDCEMVHPRTTRHRRLLVMAPGHFLLVLDWLNDRTKPHDYRQWFQFAPQWTLEHEDGRTLATSPEAEGRSAETLTILNLLDENTLGAPIRGQEEPELQGWMSDAAYSLVPCTSLAVEALERSMARFATLFVFGDDVVPDRKRTRFNASMRNGTVRWSDEKGEHALTLTLGEPGTVSASLSTTAR